MRVRIIYGEHTDKAIKDCYHYLIKIYMLRRELAQKDEGDLRKSIDGGISSKRGIRSLTRLMRPRKNAGTDQVLIYTDEGYSGEFLERPGLEKLRDDVRKGLIEAVIVYDPDRLARNLMHQLLIDDELRKNNVELIFVNGEYENTPEGKLFFYTQGSYRRVRKG